MRKVRSKLTMQCTFTKWTSSVITHSFDRRPLKISVF